MQCASLQDDFAITDCLNDLRWKEALDARNLMNVLARQTPKTFRRNEVVAIQSCWRWGNSTGEAPDFHTRLFDNDFRVQSVASDLPLAGSAKVIAKSFACDAASRINSIADIADATLSVHAGPVLDTCDGSDYNDIIDCI